MSKSFEILKVYFFLLGLVDNGFEWIFQHQSISN